MPQEAVSTICKRFSGADVSDSWGGGQDSWMLGGKMFASLDVDTKGVSVKTDAIETAQLLIEAGVGVEARRFHGSWINISRDMDDAEPRVRLAASFQLIRSSLPKKLQASFAGLA
jgi:predicted DNA-binding protein (MmcQ/YjbR family)